MLLIGNIVFIHKQLDELQHFFLARDTGTSRALTGIFLTVVADLAQLPLACYGLRNGYTMQPGIEQSFRDWGYVPPHPLSLAFLASLLILVYVHNSKLIV